MLKNPQNSCVKIWIIWNGFHSCLWKYFFSWWYVLGRHVVCYRGRALIYLCLFVFSGALWMTRCWCTRGLNGVPVVQKPTVVGPSAGCWWGEVYFWFWRCLPRFWELSAGLPTPMKVRRTRGHSFVQFYANSIIEYHVTVWVWLILTVALRTGPLIIKALFFVQECNLNTLQALVESGLCSVATTICLGLMLSQRILPRHMWLSVTVG